MNQELKYNTTRNIVCDTRGVEIPIKEHRGWRYVNYGGRKIGVSTLPLTNDEKDCVFEYIFSGGFEKYPCIAMDYWIYRWRLGNKISVTDYKKKMLSYARNTNSRTRK